MKKILQSYTFLFLVAIPVLLLDQVTKQIVRANVPLGNVYKPGLWLSQYARIIHWKNTGAAFGVFQDFGGLFTVFSFLVAVGIFIYYPRLRSDEWPLRVGLGLMFGGALGNLVDRLLHGYVLDFISIGNLPVLNVADACISSGVAVFMVGVWLQERRDKERDKETKEIEANSKMDEAEKEERETA